MKILVYTTVNEQAGLGHWVRSNALAEQARDMGHDVWLSAERRPDSSIKWLEPSFTTDYNQFDWVVVDVPDGVRADKLDPNQQFKLCVIDGIGHDNGYKPELVISQGLEGDYHAPEHLILRPELIRVREMYMPGDVEPGRWFVFGGGADKLGLIPTFNRAVYNEMADLICPEWMDYEPPWEFEQMSLHWINKPKGNSIFRTLASDGMCCLSMGMIVWEALSLGKRCYVFSLTDRHLETAMAMDKLGWIKAWPEIGLPSDEAIQQFLATRFEPDLNVIDGLGTERIIKLMEDYE